MQRFSFKDEKMKALLYGAPGSGKTYLASTAAMDDRYGRVLMLEAFGNPISIRNMPRKPDIITVNEMADFNEPYEWLVNGQPEDSAFCRDFNLKPPYQTLIVDGLTEIQRFVVRRIAGVNAVNPGDLTPALGRQGFGQLLGTMLNWAVHFIKLDMNIILTSLEASQPDANGILHRHPLIWGQSGNEISGYVFMVARVTNRIVGEQLLLGGPMKDPVFDDTHSVAFLQETPKFYAKEQYGMGVDHVTDPTMGKFLDLIEQSKADPQNT